ncbi:MAG: alpha/beta hydrolase [Oscillospiraceae bacterium]|nr:alpha/beta hydrolase [Oscillospiraceae bacterium]
MQYALDTKETVTLGGVTQHIRLRSADVSLPVVLFIHGGPGVCDRHWVLKYQSGLADAATMVCWDQRGAGLSYDKALRKEDMTVQRMVDDASELLDILRARFRQDKIFIVGHSWGSLLGALLAKQRPDAVRAYIGMGQFVEGGENERLSYQFVLDEAKKRGDKKALADLARIGEPVDGLYKSMDDMMVQRNLMTKYGGGCYAEKESIWTSMIIPLLKTPEYRLGDLWGYYKGTFFSLGALWNEVVSFDLFKTIPSLDVPVFLTEGRHDQNTPIPISRRWFEALKAPKKEWIWFENSAHSPIKEEPAAWGAAVRKIITEN